MKRRDLHPEIEKFCVEPAHAVDRFHFVHNHKGIWCEQFVNPFKVEGLKVS